VLRSFPEAKLAAEIGEVAPRRIAPVLITRPPGREQPLDDPLGSPLPRIC
jgi:hydrogenase maturation factor